MCRQRDGRKEEEEGEGREGGREGGGGGGDSEGDDHPAEDDVDTSVKERPSDGRRGLFTKNSYEQATGQGMLLAHGAEVL